jgi:hypothetical protein
MPERPDNFAAGKTATASSAQSDNPAVNALDENSDTRWCAADENKDQWLQVDLETIRPVRFVGLEFEKEAKNYGYQIQVSETAADWKTIVTKPTSDTPQWGGSHEVFHDIDVNARYVRVLFTALKDRNWASVRKLGLYPERVESDYYAPTYRYRLRFNDVIYQPGELKAIAYKDGKKIGQAIMRTAGEPAKLRLTPDRSKLKATGQDLSYILVEALDQNGTLCPLADNKVAFKIDGPADIAGVGNGNPISFEPFQADHRKLFYGKAMLILRTQQGRTGRIQVTAQSDGLKEAKTSLRSR